MYWKYLQKNIDTKIQIIYIVYKVYIQLTLGVFACKY